MTHFGVIPEPVHHVSSPPIQLTQPYNSFNFTKHRSINVIVNSSRYYLGHLLCRNCYYQQFECPIESHKHNCSKVLR